MDTIVEVHAFRETLAPYSVWCVAVDGEPSLIGDYANIATAKSHLTSPDFKIFDNSLVVWLK